MRMDSDGLGLSRRICEPQHAGPGTHGSGPGPASPASGSESVVGSVRRRAPRSSPCPMSRATATVRATSARVGETSASGGLGRAADSRADPDAPQGGLGRAARGRRTQRRGRRPRASSRRAGARRSYEPWHGLPAPAPRRAKGPPRRARAESLGRPAGQGKSQAGPSPAPWSSRHSMACDLVRLARTSRRAMVRLARTRRRALRAKRVAAGRSGRRAPRLGTEPRPVRGQSLTIASRRRKPTP